MAVDIPYYERVRKNKKMCLEHLSLEKEVKENSKALRRLTALTSTIVIQLFVILLEAFK